MSVSFARSWISSPVLIDSTPRSRSEDSREAYPKQFLALAGEDTMLQATWQRVAELADEPPIVVAGL